MQVEDRKNVYVINNTARLCANQRSKGGGPLTDDFKIAEIAKLYYIYHVKQNEIARRFHLTPMAVSRLLKKAEEKDIVRFQVRMPVSMNLELGERVQKKYGLFDCAVLETGADQTDHRESLGRYAAEYTSQLAFDGCTVGISWGRVLYRLALALGYTSLPPLHVVQLAGGFFTGDEDYMLSPNGIMKLAAAKSGVTPWFYNVPFYAGSKQMREHLLKDAGNQKIFDMLGQAHINLIGASSFDADETTMLRCGVIDERDVKELRQKGAIGDVAGFFIGEDGKEIKWSKSGLNMCVPLSLIMKAKNVICVASEKNKAKVLKSAAKMGYYNILITTNEVARAMLDEPGGKSHAGDKF